MTSANLIACSRMYNLTPEIHGLWDDFFRWLSKSAGIGRDIVEHAAPAPLSTLWGLPRRPKAFDHSPISLLNNETWARPIHTGRPIVSKVRWQETECPGPALHINLPDRL